MTNNTLSFCCVIEGEPKCRAFAAEIDPSKTVGDLKRVIKTEKSHDLRDIDAGDLSLWPVLSTLSIDEDDKDKDDDEDGPPVRLESVPHKRQLRATAKLSSVFPDRLKDDTIHIIVQQLKFATRKDEHQLIDFGIIIKPKNNVLFHWTTTAQTATLADLQTKIFGVFPHYIPDGNMDVYIRIDDNQGHGWDERESDDRICNDKQLRKLVKLAKAKYMTDLIVCLGPKTFPGWTLGDVCKCYGLSAFTNPDLTGLAPWNDIKPMSLDSDLYTKEEDLLVWEIEKKLNRIRSFRSRRPERSKDNAATMLTMVYPFIESTGSLFVGFLYSRTDGSLSGIRTLGPKHFKVMSADAHRYIVGGVTVLKEGADFQQGIAQNIIQLVSAVTDQIDDDKPQTMMRKAYGIVTDAEAYAFLELVRDRHGKMSCRMKMLKERMDYIGDGSRDATRAIFKKTTWLWFRMKDEVQARRKAAGVQGLESPTSGVVVLPV